MVLIRMVMIGCLVLLTTPAWAATRYVSLTGSDANTCAASETITTPKATFASAKTCLAAGDTLYVRAGTWTTQLDSNGVSGTAGNPITIAAYQGETVTIRTTNYARPFKQYANQGYIIYDGFVFDGVNAGDATVTSTGTWITSGMHHITLQNNEIKNWNTSGIYIEANNITIKHNSIHDQVSTCVTGKRWYGIYFHHGSTGLIEGNDIYNNPGGGMQVYPGPLSNITIKNNRVHDNNFCLSQVNIGGILVGRSSTQTTTGVTIEHNEIVNNGSAATHGGSPGINLFGPVTSTAIYNNTIYNNKSASDGSASIGYGIVFQNPGWGLPSGVTVKNNINTGNQINSVNYAGVSVTDTHTACTAGENCSATNKTTITAITSCTNTPPDFTQKAGSSCINQGTPISGVSYNGSAPDIGAYETFGYKSATINENFLDVTLDMNLNVPVLPAAGQTTWTALKSAVARGTVSADKLTGTDSIVRINFNGVACVGGETWTVTYTPGNVTDSALVGNTTVQPMSAFTAQPVTNNCGTAPPSAPGTPHVYYKMNENTGTSLNDETANNLDGTLSGTTAWGTGKEGSGVTMTDATAGDITILYGNAVNPSTQSLTTAFWVNVPSGLTASERFYFGTQTLGTNQRFYIATKESTWRLGIQASSYASTPSNLTVAAGWNRLCLVADSATDIATLTVNGVVGTTGAVKAYTSYAIPGDFILGSPSGSDSLTPGVTYDSVKVWTSAESCADDWAAENPVTPAPTGTFSQPAFQFHNAYFDAGGNVVNLAPVGTAISWRSGVPFAITTQVDCTIANCDPVGMRIRYSLNGGAFQEVPDIMGPDQISFIGTTDPSVMQGAVTCCLSGALTPIHGQTQLTNAATPIVDLALNSSTVQRRVLYLGQSAVVADTYDFKEYDQQGNAMASYTPAGGARVTVSAATLDAPTGLHLASQQGANVALVWTPSTDIALAGYRLYQSAVQGVQGSLVETITQATARATQSSATTWHGHPTPGTWYYLITQFDTGGQESPIPPELTVVVPAAIARTARTP